MKTLKTISLFTLIFLVFGSCSKDKSLENHIDKNDGVWNIDRVDWAIVSQDNSGQKLSSGTTYNAGTFTFDKGNGKYSYTVDTTSRSGNYTWNVSSQKVSVVALYESVNFNTGAVVQKTVTYSSTSAGKTSMVLEGTETDQEVGSGFNQFVLTGTFHLSKK